MLCKSYQSFPKPIDNEQNNAKNLTNVITPPNNLITNTWLCKPSDYN